MAEPTPRKTTRKSAFSCEACRKRKVKCNGATPSCARCASRGEPCVYTITPSISYTKSLEARVAQLEETLAKLQGNRLDRASESSPDGSAGFQSNSPVDDTPREENSEDVPDLTGGFQGLTVEDDGRISFHGQTSLFHLPGEVVNELATNSQIPAEMEARKERLINNALRQRAFEQLSGIPEPIQYLLDFHWCWIQPLFNFVYRPAFTRDMKVAGPYYSDALLNAIVSHSIRWCKDQPQVIPLLEAYGGTNKFFEAAVSGVFDTLKTGYPRIPTVQTLLLLSAQECGRGNRTQAWLYSGMAFRLVEDLGISVDSRKYSRSVPFSDEDIEVRNRLFWSCYFWDKLISLYFGRSPMIQHSRVSPPRMILDDTAEIECWYPHGVTFPEGTQYPPMQAHSTSCFMKMCSLAEILNQIIIHIYDPLRQTGETELRNCVSEQDKNLRRWWDDLPDYLKLITSSLPQFCPPSHIVTLNCLYHTVNILLHRAILCGRSLGSSSKEQSDAKQHLIQCLNSATSILALFDLYRRTFGDGHVVLSLAYSVYTASSIFLLEIKALKFAAPATVEKVKYCVQSLKRLQGANPVVKTGLGLIHQELQKLQVNIDVASPTSTSSNISPIHPNPPQTCPGQQQQQSASNHESPIAPSSSVSAPSSIHTAASTISKSSPQAPFESYQYQQHMTPFTLPQQQTAYHTANVSGTPHFHSGAMAPDSMLNLDGATLPYDNLPEVYQAFFDTEPISANMHPGGYDPVGWGTSPGAAPR